MKFLGALLVSLALPFAALASPEWDQLVAKMINEGTPLEFQHGELRSLRHIEPSDISLPHVAEYISTIGAVDFEGRYVAFSVSAVNEDWRLTDTGYWNIEQWIFESDLDGNMTRFFHRTIVEDGEGRVLEIIDHPKDPIDSPEMTGRWESLKKVWYGR